MNKLQHSQAYFAVNSLFGNTIFSSSAWYQGIVRNILESGELGLTTANYLYHYEKWKQTKPFGMLLGNNHIKNIFPSEIKPFYSGVVSQILKDKNRKK